MQDPPNVGDLLKHSPLFLDFDDGGIALLARDSYTVHVSRYDFIFRRGDRVDGFYAVVVGATRLVLPGAHDQYKVIEFFGSGKCFGEPFIFLNRPYTTDTQAMENSLLVQIGKRTVGDILYVHPRLARQMLTGLSTRLHTLMYDVGTMNLQSASEQLIGHLFSLPREFDRTRFPCGKSLVASKFGLVPTTLSRVLRQLIRDGLARVKGRGVMIQNTTVPQRQLMTGQQQKLDAGQSSVVSS